MRVDKIFQGVFIIKVELKFFLFQILGVGIIWLGMTIFFNKLEGSGVYIYYGVTSWLLFLIVLAGKHYFGERKEKQKENDEKNL